MSSTATEEPGRDGALPHTDPRPVDQIVSETYLEAVDDTITYAMYQPEQPREDEAVLVLPPHEPPHPDRLPMQEQYEWMHDLATGLAEYGYPTVTFNTRDDGTARAHEYCDRYDAAGVVQRGLKWYMKSRPSREGTRQEDTDAMIDYVYDTVLDGTGVMHLVGVSEGGSDAVTWTEDEIPIGRRAAINPYRREGDEEKVMPGSWIGVTPGDQLVPPEEHGYVFAAKAPEPVELYKFNQGNHLAGITVTRRESIPYGRIFNDTRVESDEEEHILSTVIPEWLAAY